MLNPSRLTTSRTRWSTISARNSRAHGAAHPTTVTETIACTITARLISHKHTLQELRKQAGNNPDILHYITPKRQRHKKRSPSDDTVTQHHVHASRSQENQTHSTQPRTIQNPQKAPAPVPHVTRHRLDQ